MAEWQAYAQLEPFGPPAAFWQAGLIAATLANVNRTKKTQKVLTAEDFMPQSMRHEPEEATREAVAERVAQTFQALAELPNGVLKP